jgi:hypothetical protein
MLKQLLALSFGLVIHLSAVDAGNATPPQSSVGSSTVAYIVQPDVRREAPARVNSASGTTSTSGGARRRDAVAANRGSDNALVSYLQGESLTELAHDLALHDKDQARDLVHHEMISLHQRYLLDHPALTGRLHVNVPAQTRDNVLSHYARGESLETIAAEFDLYGPNDAREVVRDALSTLTRTLRRAR